MSVLLHDIRYSIRRLLRRPGFTLVAVLSIGLGVGANSAVFTMVNALVLRAAPIQDPGRVLEIYPAYDGIVELSAISYPELRDIRAGTEGILSVVGLEIVVVQENVPEGGRTLVVNVVSGDYFDVLGIPLAAGRAFEPAEYRAIGTEPVVVLGHSHWQRRFGGDPAAVGQSLRINGRPYTIIGVAAAGAGGPVPGMPGDLWAPDTMTNDLRAIQGNLHDSRGSHNLFLHARLHPDATFAEAQAALDRVTAQTHQDYPDYDDRWGLIALRGSQVAVHPLIDGVLLAGAGVIMGIVVLVLLVACVNLAAFLLAQAADRRKEVAMRLALGASRWRLIRQLVTETALLGLAGGGVGLGLGFVALRLLGSFQMVGAIEFDFGFVPDLRVVAFTLGIALAAGLFFGLVPALQTSRPELAPTLKDESVAGRAPGLFSLRNALVVSQVAVSCVLLVSAGLFLRSLQEASAADPGFGRAPTAVVSLGLLPDRYDQQTGLEFYRRLMTEIGALPEVDSVALVDNLALSGTSFNMDGISVPGVDPPASRNDWQIDVVTISPEYFETAGVPILRGRTFSWDDRRDGNRVAIVNQAMAERFWPDETAVGKAFFERGTAYEIVGVARNTDVRRLGEPSLPYIYYPMTQVGGLQLQLLARTSGRDARPVATRILQLARAADPDIMVLDVKTMDDHLGFMLYPFRIGGQLLGVFGLLTVLLASIGLYGVVSYSASARTREIGVRMSLGAGRADVIGLVLRGGVGLVVVGTLLGLGIAWFAAPLASSLLWIPPLDPVTFAAATAMMLATGVLASLLPALRTSQVDPVRALKSE